MVDEVSPAGEDECLGKGTLLEPYGGPRFLITAGLDIAFLLIILSNQIIAALGHSPTPIDPLFTYLVTAANGIYFVSRSVEKNQV
jgi:hypothetical protein